jgi:hypothetical protein
LGEVEAQGADEEGGDPAGEFLLRTH